MVDVRLAGVGEDDLSEALLLLRRGYVAVVEGGVILLAAVEEAAGCSVRGLWQLMQSSGRQAF